MTPASPDRIAPGFEIIITKDTCAYQVLEIRRDGHVLHEGVEVAGPAQPGDWHHYLRDLGGGVIEVGWENADAMTGA